MATKGKVVDAAKLESAMPGLIEKLTTLQASLGPHEKAILAEILTSAAQHTKNVQSHAEGAHNIQFAKSMSVHSTAHLQQSYVDLAKKLKP